MVSGLTLRSGGAGVLSLFRQMGITNRNLAVNQQRLASGLRINSAKDDPAGLVQSQILRAEIAGTDKRIQSLTNQSNVLNTAEASLGEISNLLVSIRTSVVAAQGSLTAGQLATEQDNINTALDAIDSIAQSSAFGTQNLLNGQSSIQISAKNSNLLDLQIRSLSFGGASSRTLTLNVTAEGTRATSTVIDPSTDPVVAGGDITLRVNGPLGSRDIALLDGATGDDLLSAINSDVLSTGVFAQLNGSALEVLSADLGADQTITLSQVSGAGTFSPGTLTATGTDAQATLDGLNAFATGNSIRGVGTSFNVSLDLQEGAGAGAFAFTAVDSGFGISIAANGSGQFNIGILFANSANLGSAQRSFGLGSIGGALSSLRSGGANDLSTDPNNALVIADESINDVSGGRAFLGSIVTNLLQSGIDSLQSQSDFMSDSFSSITDVDFAAETVSFTTNQILQQAQIATLASSNLQNQRVFDLLLLQGTTL